MNVKYPEVIGTNFDRRSQILACLRLLDERVDERVVDKPDKRTKMGQGRKVYHQQGNDWERRSERAGWKGENTVT